MYSNGTVKLSHAPFVRDFIEECGLTECSSAFTPAPAGVIAGKKWCPEIVVKNTSNAKARPCIRWELHLLNKQTPTKARGTSFYLGITGKQRPTANSLHIAPLVPGVGGCVLRAEFKSLAVGNIAQVGAPVLRPSPLRTQTCAPQLQ
jgi:hypothetical protein